MSKNTTVVLSASDAELDDIVAEGQERFEYIVDKDPSPKQEFYALLITALTGVEVSPKQYQAMISTHRFIQASDLNRARADYRPRTAASVAKAATTLLAHADDLLVDDAGAVISRDNTSIPDSVADAVNSRLAEMESLRIAKSAEAALVAEAVRVVEKPVVEEPAEEVFAQGSDFVGESIFESSKEDLIYQLLSLEFADSEDDEAYAKREKQLKRWGVPRLAEAVANASESVG